MDQTGIDAASEREAFAAPLSTVWCAIDRTNVREMVDQTLGSWNRLAAWFKLLDDLRQVA